MAPTAAAPVTRWSVTAAGPAVRSSHTIGEWLRASSRTAKATTPTAAADASARVRKSSRRSGSRVSSVR